MAVHTLPCRDISPEHQRERSFTLLRDYIERDIARYSPYYRRLFREGNIDVTELRQPADYARLVPLTNKEDFRKDADAFVLQPRWPGCAAHADSEEISHEYLALYRRRASQTFTAFADIEPPPSEESLVYREFLRDWQPLVTTHSGGSTGATIRGVWTHSDVTGPLFRSGLFHHNIVSWRGTQKYMSLLPAGEHLGFVAGLLVPVMHAQPIRLGFGGRVIATEEQIRMAAQAGIEVLIGTTSYVTSWLASAVGMLERQVIDGLHKLELIIVAGEALTQQFRASIKRSLEALGSPTARLVQGMSSTELKSAGFRECDEGTGLHVDPRHFFIEILDPATLRPVPPGEPGVLVWSHIDWHGTAILRYWSGDIVEGGATFTRCEKCGLVVPRLHPPLRRIGSDYLKVRGARVDLVEIRAALEAIAGHDAFQIEIQHDENAPGKERVVLYTLNANASAEAALRSAVRRSADLRLDAVIFVSPAELQARLYQGENWKPRWLVHVAIDAVERN